MVLITPLIGAAALLSSFASALPRPDSAIGDEVGVSAPDGTPITNSRELASQTSAEAAAKTASSDSGSYGSSGYGSSDSGSYGSSGYGSSGYGSSGYGSSGYGSSESSGCGESGCDGSSSSTTILDSTSTMAYESTSTMAYSMPSYGSGGSNWQNSGYDDCVQQCIASHGAPPATYTPPTSTSGSEGSSGSGSTIRVIVAPSAGVFRYVPAFVNASVGTTIEFMWGADNHTVTKASALLPCNHSTEDPSFISGVQKKDFTFTQVVNDTNPTFFYCGVPTHCQKGMFGIINPPSDFGSPTSVSGMMQGMVSSDPALEAYAAYSANVTQGKAGSNWGGSISLDGMPDWSHSLVAENVLYTRNLLAMNPELVKDDGSIDMNSFGTTPLMIPADVSSTINAATSSDGAPSSSSSSPSDNTGSSDSSSAAQTTESAAGATTNNNGALSVTSSKALVAVMALVATFFAL